MKLYNYINHIIINHTTVYHNACAMYHVFFHGFLWQFFSVKCSKVHSGDALFSDHVVGNPSFNKKTCFQTFTVYG